MPALQGLHAVRKTLDKEFMSMANARTVTIAAVLALGLPAFAGAQTLPSSPASAPELRERGPATTAPPAVAQRPRRPEEQPAPTPAAPAPPAAPVAPPEQPKETTPGFSGPTSVRHPSPIETSPDFVPIPDRWRLGLPHWNRYERPLFKDIPYSPGRWWDPYNQNVIKGDYPIFGQDIFLSFSAISDSILELRRIPLPSNVSANRPNSDEFFGEGDQLFYNQNFIFSLEIFKGDTAFRPRDWEFRLTPIINLNYLDTRETGVVNIDVRDGTTRTEHHVTLQEFFVEYHLGDISPQYDFVSTRSGIQPFTSDFRGFIFSDNQLGFRTFGILGSNQNQFNVAYFRPLEKDTNSGLLRVFDTRGQHVGIVNYFRQDLFVPGYNLNASVHYLHDAGGTHFDENGFLVRPAAIGTLDQKVLDAVWLGWTGDGHIGPLNITHAVYQVLGRESRSPFDGRSHDISAQMAALELSVDMDWFRPKFSFFWASGDEKPFNKTARGFDNIFDNPNFAGGGFSYWVRQGLPLTQTGLELKGRNSLVTPLRSSKLEGQPNFINPGVFLVGAGADIDVTPKLRASVNVNFLRFQHTQVFERILFQPNIGHDIGIDSSLGIRYRPFLNENVVVTAGFAALVAGDGLRDIYTEEQFTLGQNGLERQRNDFTFDPLYSAFMALTFTY
jgi:hypothetical protein